MSGEPAETRHTLLIPLAGPMQAWGSRSRFDDRDTHTEPTKSGVLGLVCAALGWERGRPLDTLAALRFGVRVDSGGRAMTDFHTAQEVARAGGNGTTTVTSRRHYLSDARFLAGLEGGDNELRLLREIETALRNPKWPLSLGRKSFPLTIPPYLPEGSLQEGKCLKTALKEQPWRYLHSREPDANDKRLPGQQRTLRLILEDSTGTIIQADGAPGNFESRNFGLRRLESDSCVFPEEKKPWL